MNGRQHVPPSLRRSFTIAFGDMAHFEITGPAGYLLQDVLALKKAPYPLSALVCDEVLREQFIV